MRVEYSKFSMSEAASRHGCPPPPLPSSTTPPPIPCHNQCRGTPIRTSDDKASDGDGTCPSAPGMGGCQGGKIWTCQGHRCCLILTPSLPLPRPLLPSPSSSSRDRTPPRVRETDLPSRTCSSNNVTLM